MTPYINIHTHCGEDVVIVAGGRVLPCRGVHPWDAAAGAAEFSTDGLAAIGEIGLDYARSVDREIQKKVFAAQLDMAEKAGLPVVLHSVRALDDTLAMLDGRQLRAVIFHGFTGSRESADRITRAGYYVSFGERAFASPKTIETLRTIIAGRLFLETDIAGTPIEEIYARAAEVRGAEVEELKEQIAGNFKKIFG